MTAGSSYTVYFLCSCYCFIQSKYCTYQIRISDSSGEITSSGHLPAPAFSCDKRLLELLSDSHHPPRCCLDLSVFLGELTPSFPLIVQKYFSSSLVSTNSGKRAETLRAPDFPYGRPALSVTCWPSPASVWPPHIAVPPPWPGLPHGQQLTPMTFPGDLVLQNLKALGKHH